MLCAGLSAGIMGSSSAATNDTINGAVFDMASNALLDSVLVSSEGTSTRTMPNGSFTLILPNASGVITQNGQQQQRRGVEWNCAKNSVFWPENSGEVSIVIRNCAGRTEARFHSVNSMTNTSCSIANLSQGIYIATIRVASQTTVYRILKFQNGIHNSLTMVSQKATDRNLAKTGTVRPHLLVFSKAGYNPDSITVAAATTTTNMVTAKLLGTNYTVVFNGKDLAGWASDNMNNWKVNTADSAIQCTGLARGYVYTTGKYLHYRIIFTIRSNNSGGHMPCVLVVGQDVNADAMAAYQFQLPTTWTWDYRPGANNEGLQFVTKYADPVTNNANWAQCEVLVDTRNGHASAAVAQPPGTKATRVISFYDASVKTYNAAPFGIQAHNAGVSDEYKNIFVEENPMVDSLITTR